MTTLKNTHINIVLGYCWVHALGSVAGVINPFVICFLCCMFVLILAVKERLSLICSLNNLSIWDEFAFLSDRLSG